MNEYERGWRHDRLIDERVRAAAPWVFSAILCIAVASLVLADNPLYAVAAFLGLLAVGSAFFLPEWALLGVTVLAPLSVYTQEWGSLIPGAGITPVNAIIIILVIGAFLQRYSPTAPATDATKVDKVLLLFLGWSAFSIVVSIMTWGANTQTTPAIGEWLQFASGIITYWVVRRRFHNTKLAAAGVVIVCALVLFESVVVIHQYRGLNTGAFNWDLKKVIAGTFPPGNSNDIGTYLSVYGTVAIGLFLAARQSIWRWAALLVYVVAVAATFATYSRGAYLALAAGLLVVTLYKHRRYLIPALLVFAVIPTLLPASIRDRMQTSGDESSEARFPLWQRGMAIAATNPLGIGWRGFAQYQITTGQTLRDPHSMYVLVAAEQGPVGLGLFVMLLVVTGKEIVRCIKRAKTPMAQGLGIGMFGALVAFSVNNLFGSRMMWFYSTQHFWLMLGLLTVLTNGPPGTVVEEEPDPEPVEKTVSPWRYRSYV
ncbi:MAG TPA: O-antigen ligase family protein [Armatimonadota bacterium]|jgi:hypothetical protein